MAMYSRQWFIVMSQYPRDRNADRGGSSVQLWQRVARVRWLAESIHDEIAAQQLAQFAEELATRATTRDLIDRS